MLEDKQKSGIKNLKKPGVSRLLDIIAWIILILAAVSIINTVILYSRIVTQYLEQGFDAGEVISQFVSSQLLPGIIEPLAVYGGIAAALFGLSMINKKIAKYLEPSCETCNDEIHESIDESSSNIDELSNNMDEPSSNIEEDNAEEANR